MKKKKETVIVEKHLDWKDLINQIQHFLKTEEFQVLKLHIELSFFIFLHDCKCQSSLF